MADATLLSTASPKELGKQLRAVRRRKGLSLSEVARGAGLSRRELVAYERGKVEIPESDLWVIAGSCGVDVAELVPPTDPKALASAPETIEDTISQLRSHQPDGIQRHLDTLYALRALPPGSVVQLQERERVAIAAALGNDAASIETRLVETMHVSRDEARRLRALVAPDAPRYSPLALDAPPVPEPAPAVPAPAAPAPFDELSLEARFESVAVTLPDHSSGPVDVFEELAKLPEPVALAEHVDGNHDVFAPPPEPVSVQASAEAGASGAFATWSSVRSALPEPNAPVVVEPTPSTGEPASPTFGASHAPPIDVFGRLDAPTMPDWPGTESDPGDEDGGARHDPRRWAAPAPGETTWDAWLPTPDDLPPENIVEFVDDYVVDGGVLGDATVDELTDAAAEADALAEPDTETETTPYASQWSAWATSASTEDNIGIGDHTSPPGHEVDGLGGLSELSEPAAASAEAGSWSPAWMREPDPAASSTGFYVDWGGTDAPAEEQPAARDAAPADDQAWYAPEDPAPISWRPLADTVLAAVAAELAATRAQAPAPEPDPEPEPAEEEFVTAGAEWDLGNALPLVEVRGQGGLVMRRADERWALADVSAATNFALEVDVDFRSGPGFGVLFCADIDGDGHMSGYSFDVDPIHEGGSYLVRQWHADRELWNPIARVPARDPADMHGALVLRVVVVDDAMSASVNGDVVLHVDNLKQACADRNREPATGDRVGIQAWSSSDLVIDTLRVAER